MTTFILLILLATLIAGLRYHRLWRGSAGLVAMGATIVCALGLSFARACQITRSEIAIVPLKIHYAIGFRLGELAADRVGSERPHVLLIRPATFHPAHRRIVEAQSRGVKDAMRERHPRWETEEVKLYDENPLPLSVPRIGAEDLREWARRYDGLQSIISLAGAPRIEDRDGPADIPALVVLSFTDPSELRLAFERGWLAACVFQFDSGRDLNISKMMAREIFERTCKLVTDADARADHVQWSR